MSEETRKQREARRSVEFAELDYPEGKIIAELRAENEELKVALENQVITYAGDLAFDMSNRLHAVQIEIAKLKMQHERDQERLKVALEKVRDLVELIENAVLHQCGLSTIADSAKFEAVRTMLRGGNHGS